MDERAAELLAIPDDTLFTHGGCHVFALALREFTRLPLLWVREDGGSWDHLVCDPGGELFVDFFGWFSRSEYLREEMLDGRAIRFVRIAEEEVRSRFVTVRGQGYYAHPDFLVPATERARQWIATHRAYFDGTKKVAIPGLSRVKTVGTDEMFP
jgi:hypothetical protein